MLYHSFPRFAQHKGLNRIEYGTAILESILRYGLLLVPESIHFPIIDSNNPYDRGTIIFQRRACFTYIDNQSRLTEHSSVFGEFAIGVKTEILRRLGAVPVMYVPRPTENLDSRSYSSFANGLIHQLRDVGSVLDEINELYKSLSGESREELVEISDPNGLLIRVDNDSALKILEIIRKGKGSFTQMLNYIWAMSNLFYYADSARECDYFKDLDLEYYRQMEWRIIAGLFLDERLDRELTGGEKFHLRGMSDFFEKTVETPSGKRSRLDATRIVASDGSEQFRNFVSQIVIPREARFKVEQIVSQFEISPTIVEL